MGQLEAENGRVVGAEHGSVTQVGVMTIPSRFSESDHVDHKRVDSFGLLPFFFPKQDEAGDI